MDSIPAISELKLSFIRAQVRILSESLEPPENWRDYAGPSEDDDLSDKVVEDALHKLNDALKRHIRIAYPSQAIHQTVQQIVILYWDAVKQGIQNRDYEKGIKRSIDLSNHDDIAKLPINLEHQSATDQDRTRYQQLRERLIALDSRRKQRQGRLNQLRQLQQLLEPFKQPQKNIQPNLVNRDGELAQELEKMRMLVARVAGRLNQKKRKRDGHESNTSYSLGSEQKLEALLDMT